MLSRLRARISALRDEDTGSSLAELMVAMAITTVVGAIALSFFVWTGHSTSDAAENSATTDGARLAVSAMASALRVADSPTDQAGATTYRILEPLSHSTISFFANDNLNRAGSASRTLPTRVTYTVSGGTVTESRYLPLPGAVAKPSTWTSNYPTTPTTTRTLLRGAASVRFDYTLLSASGVLGPVADKDLATSGESAQVVSVTVTVTMTATPGRPAQTFTATAVLTGSTS